MLTQVMTLINDNDLVLHIKRGISSTLSSLSGISILPRDPLFGDVMPDSNTICSVALIVVVCVAVLVVVAAIRVPIRVTGWRGVVFMVFVVLFGSVVVLSALLVAGRVCFGGCW